MVQTSQQTFFPRTPGKQWTHRFLNEFNIHVSSTSNAHSFFKLPPPDLASHSQVPSFILEYHRDTTGPKCDNTESLLPLPARRYFRYLADASRSSCLYDPAAFGEQGQKQDPGSPAQFELARFLLGELLGFERITVKEEDEGAPGPKLGTTGCIFQQGIRLPLMMCFAPDSRVQPLEEGEPQSEYVPCDLDLCLFDPSYEACLLFQISSRQSTIPSLHSRLDTLESSLVAAAIAELYQINAGPVPAIISNPKVEKKVYPAMVMVGTAMIFYRIEVGYELVPSVAKYGWEGKWERPQEETVVWRYIPRKQGLNSDREVEEWERRYLIEGMKDLECRREALRALLAFKEFVKNVAEGTYEATEELHHRKPKREDDEDKPGEKRCQMLIAVSHY